MSLAASVYRTLLLLAALALAGCTSTEQQPVDAPRGASESVAPDAPSAAAPTTPSFDTYAALGDSFTAGPYVPVTDLAGGCFRSSGNYPSLLAERLRVAELVDVSCAGADTRHLFRPQHPIRDSSVPPQVEALDETTDLVTVGIGGNDFGLFGTLVVRCTELRAADPDGAPCRDFFEAEGVDLDEIPDAIGRRVGRAVREVQERAPEATVLLVGYLRLVPSSGGCPEAGMATGDYRMAHAVTRDLNEALARAARRAGVGFVDMFAASAGHDICSDDPWVQGRRTDQRAAFAFHPRPEGMAAVTERIMDQLSDDRPAAS